MTPAEPLEPSAQFEAARRTTTVLVFDERCTLFYSRLLSVYGSLGVETQNSLQPLLEPEYSFN